MISIPDMYTDRPSILSSFARDIPIGFGLFESQPESEQQVSSSSSLRWNTKIIQMYLLSSKPSRAELLISLFNTIFPLADFT